MRAIVFVIGVALVSAVPAGAQEPINVPWERVLPSLPSRGDVQPHAVPGCKHGSLACVKRVERKLRRQFKRLDAACDHRVIASLAYLRITQALRRDLSRRQPRFFRHKRWMAFVITTSPTPTSRRSGRYERGQPVPESWRHFYDAATKGDTNAVQDLLLFSNAHAQHDLPFSYASMGVRTRGGARASTTTTA